MYNCDRHPLLHGKIFIIGLKFPRHSPFDQSRAPLQYMRGLRADPKAKQVTLRLMATTDLHVHVLAYDYYADKPSEHVGLERTAELIAQARHEVPDALLFDNGDFLQGNPMGDFIARNPDFATHPVHPVFAAMNQLGYQAATLGNHEFNSGLDFLAEALKGANFPIVSANIVSKQGVSADLDVTFVSPYVLLDRVLTDGNGHLHPLRIGVIGFAPPQIMQWDRGHLEGRLTARDIVDAATDWVPQMKAAGADVIVALAHSGIGPTDGVEDAENAASRLALVPGIDAIICGHSHMVFPAQDFPAFEGVDALRGTLFGKPAVMPGFYGSHLGVIDLLLDFGPEGWRVMDSTSEARPISGQISALQTELGQTELGQSVVNAHQRTLEYTRRTVGQNGRALHSYFAALGANTATRIVADAQAAYVRSALQGRPEADLPLLSGAAPFKAGGRGGRKTTPLWRPAIWRCAISPIFTSFPTPSLRCGSPARRCWNGWKTRSGYSRNCALMRQTSCCWTPTFHFIILT